MLLNGSYFTHHTKLLPLELRPSFKSICGNNVFKQTNIPLSVLDPKPWAVTLRRNVRVNLTNRNETDVAVYCPDLFLRVNRAEQPRLGEEPGFF